MLLWISFDLSVGRKIRPKEGNYVCKPSVLHRRCNDGALLTVLLRPRLTASKDRCKRYHRSDNRWESYRWSWYWRCIPPRPRLHRGDFASFDSRSPRRNIRSPFAVSPHFKYPILNKTKLNDKGWWYVRILDQLCGKPNHKRRRPNPVDRPSVSATDSGRTSFLWYHVLPRITQVCSPRRYT